MAMRCQWVARRRDANLFVCIQRRGSIGSCPACRGAHACTRAAAERRRASQRAASRARRSPLSLSSVSRQLRICAFRWAISTRARGLRRGAPCSCGLGRRRGERTGAVRCSGRRRTAARPRSARARRAPHARRGASTVWRSRRDARVASCPTSADMAPAQPPRSVAGADTDAGADAGAERETQQRVALAKHTTAQLKVRGRTRASASSTRRSTRRSASPRAHHVPQR